MTKKLLLLLLLLTPLSSLAAVKTLQVTLGSGNTTVITAGAHQNCRWIVFQDNATHNIRIGDSNTSSTRGLALASGGASFYIGPDSSGSARDLGGWYINGTSGDVVDVIYDDGN